MVKTVQQILYMTTYTPSIRSEVDGWTFECGDVDMDKVLQDPNIHVGFLKGWEAGLYYHPKTPAHALRLGWKLLAPPEKFDMGLEKYPWGWHWIMVREVETNMLGAYK